MGAITLVSISKYPEQYEARTPDGQTIGYIRIKMGYCDVWCPDAGGKDLVYEADVKWELDGFRTNRERKKHLYRAKKAIMNWYLQSQLLPSE